MKMKTMYTPSWQTKRFKYIVSWQKGKQPEGLSGAIDNGELLPYLTMEYLRGEASASTLYAQPGSNAVIAKDNDVILLWDGANAGEFLDGKRGLVSSTSALLIPRSVQPRFLFYACKSAQLKLQQTTVGMGVPHVSGNSLGQMLFSIPSPVEQLQIAAYLDEQTAKIDRLVGMRRRQMELLKEQRAALIQQAVTCGLNPDVNKRQTGIEWIGEIPAHWKKTKLLGIARRGRGMFVNGPFGSDLLTNELTDSGVPVIYIRDIKAAGYLRVSEVCVTTEKAKALDVFRVDGGDIVVAKVGNPPGTAAVYPESQPSGIVTQDVIRIKTNPRFVDAEYIVHWLNSQAGQASIDQISVESTRMRVDLESYKNLRIYLPLLQEQELIVQYIQRESTQLNDLISSYAHQLTLLAEYRASLIHECVTGQRLVNDASPAKGLSL